MILNKEITEFLSSEITASAEIENYCQTKYGKSLLVFIGVDVNNPPSEEDMPCLIIEPTVKNIGSQEAKFDYEILLHIAIKGSEKPTVNGNKVLYEGVYDIEELGELIVGVLKKQIGIKSNMDAYGVDFYQDEINAFPVYSGVVVVGMSVPNIIGEDKITFNC